MTSYTVRFLLGFWPGPLSPHRSAGSSPHPNSKCWCSSRLSPEPPWLLTPESLTQAAAFSRRDRCCHAKILPWPRLHSQPETLTLSPPPYIPNWLSQKLMAQNAFKSKLTAARPTSQKAGSSPYRFSIFLTCPYAIHHHIVWYDPLTSSSPSKDTSTLATLGQTPITPCLP